jgi:hypothetical protein
MSSSSSLTKWVVLGAGALAAAWAGWELYQSAQQRRKGDRSSSSASASSSKESAIPACRPLHWVLKVGDLRASVDFYNSVLGMEIQRHEEFKEGCEATCNGPYSGWWSKTMMSFPQTGEGAFSLELTYNYGIESYELGNDLGQSRSDATAQREQSQVRSRLTLSRALILSLLQLACMYACPVHWIALVPRVTMSSDRESPECIASRHRMDNGSTCTPRLTLQLLQILQIHSCTYR